MAEGSSSNTFNMVNDASSPNNDTFILGWVSEFNCYTINGYQTPHFENWRSPSGESSSTMEQAQRKSRRDLEKAVLDQVINLTFRLLKCQNEDVYILEMREDAKRHNKYYVLEPKEKEGTKTLTTKDFRMKEKVVKEVSEDVEPLTDNKYHLSLRQRIQGKWRLETRKRNLDSDKVDKFYYHEKVTRAIRSFPDVASFILYGMIPEIARKEQKKT